MPLELGVRQAVYKVKIQDGIICVSDTPAIPAIPPPKHDDP